VIPEAQRLMQQLSPGARRIVMNTGHAPQLAQPEVLVERLDAAMREFIQLK
jgi:pimeloyl-ACP methyl ester carboxylesterase